LEDEILGEQIQSVGKKWSKIAALIPGRTEHSVKNRYRKLIKEHFKNDLRSQEEIDQSLIDILLAMQGEEAVSLKIKIPSSLLQSAGGNT